MPVDFITIESLSTLAGVVIAVNILTQFTKKFFKFSPRWLVLVYAIFLNFAYLYLRGTFNKETIFLAILNSIVAAVAALGTYQVVRDAKMRKKN